MASNRISKVTTRTGDQGKTKLATGRTVGKDSVYVRTVGAVDELNSHIGMAMALLSEQSSKDDHVLGESIDLHAMLTEVQQGLFDMGAVLAMEGAYEAPSCASLEHHTESINARLPPLTEFVLPGGNRCTAQMHICRTVCRRAEAEMWALIAQAEASDSLGDSARYLNRLSDLFFVAARALNQQDEQQWHGPQ